MSVPSDNSKELTKKIYNAQKENPLKGDWILMVKQDFEDIGPIFNEKEIIKETQFQLKERIKKSLRSHMGDSCRNGNTRYAGTLHI